MFPKLIFIDINPDLVVQIASLLEANPIIKVGEELIPIKEHINYECVTSDINTYIEHKNIGFTSAANGEGMLLGGVDHALRNMFPLVQDIINETIADNGYVNKYHRHFIPVGSATIVPVCYIEENIANNNQYLITAPTMLNPSNVKNTKNCYHALYAVLRVVNKYNTFLINQKQPLIETILCPGMGTGVGGISYEDAAQQFLEAIIDFISIDLTGKLIPAEDVKDMFVDISKEPNVFIKSPIKMITLQPQWYTYVRYRKKNTTNETSNVIQSE